MAVQFASTSATPCSASSDNVRALPPLAQNFRGCNGQEESRETASRRSLSTDERRNWAAYLGEMFYRDIFTDNFVTMKTSESPSLQFPARRLRDIAGIREICAWTNYVVSGERREFRNVNEILINYWGQKRQIFLSTPIHRILRLSNFK